MNPGNLQKKIKPGKIIRLEKGKGKAESKAIPGFQVWLAERVVGGTPDRTEDKRGMSVRSELGLRLNLQTLPSDKKYLFFMLME